MQNPCPSPSEEKTKLSELINKLLVIENQAVFFLVISRVEYNELINSCLLVNL